MPLEAEMKFRIPAQQVAERFWEDPRIHNALLGEPKTKEMDGLYYDTADNAMSARSATLRLRKEDGVTIATCKTKSELEGSLFLRNEWQCVADNWEDGLRCLTEKGAPSYLLDVGALEPRCRVVFTRCCAPLLLPDGTTTELAIDKGRLEADGKTEDLYELELEYLTGHMETLRELGEYLEKKYRLGKEYYSKYARALKLIRSRGQ